MKQVFISHSSMDKQIADKVVESLEANGISCWIAPRDIPAGSNYAAQITKGIRECPVLLLVFSENSNSSPAVIREAQMAFEEKKIIIPLRIHKVPPCDEFNFYLAGLQWWDVTLDNLIFDGLLRDISSALNITEFQTIPFTPASAPVQRAKPSIRNAIIIAASIVVGVAALSVLLVILLRNGGTEQNGRPAWADYGREASPAPPEFTPAPEASPGPPEYTPAPEASPGPPEYTPAPEALPAPPDVTPPPGASPQPTPTPTPDATPAPTPEAFIGYPGFEFIPPLTSVSHNARAYWGVAELPRNHDRFQAIFLYSLAEAHFIPETNLFDEALVDGGFIIQAVENIVDFTELFFFHPGQNVSLKYSYNWETGVLIVAIGRGNVYEQMMAALAQSLLVGRWRAVFGINELVYFADGTGRLEIPDEAGEQRFPFIWFTENQRLTYLTGPYVGTVWEYIYDGSVLTFRAEDGGTAVFTRVAD